MKQSIVLKALRDMSCEPIGYSKMQWFSKIDLIEKQFQP